MIILASNSPRRKELLRLICPTFAIEPANIVETVDKNLPLPEIPAHLARKKAAHVRQSHPDDIVIGCDTGVFINNMMLGKPGSDRSAFEMLRLLSGKSSLPMRLLAENTARDHLHQDHADVLPCTYQ